MNPTETAPGLWYWTVAHPDWEQGDDWPQQVAQVAYQADDALVLFDPLIPADDDATFWRFLEDQRENRDRPIRILLTAPWHQRSASTVAARLGAAVWMHPAGQQRLSFQPVACPLPPEIEALDLPGTDEGQLAFHVGPTQTLIVAEFLLGTAGGLRVLPSPALYDNQAFRRFLQHLADRPIEQVLVAHGQPVLGNASAEIRNALSTYPRP
jgi:glyoxylase-like metal-dependent hydrolase (beta-lactamase superfamily II)